MEQFSDARKVLEMLLRPAFSVKDGIIEHINQAAGNHMITTGTAIKDLLHTGQEEYEALEDGVLYLTLRLDKQLLGASVTRMESFDLFCIEQDEQQPHLQAMALAAVSLRAPLSDIMITTDRILPELDSSDATVQQYAAMLRQAAFQLVRLVDNMSDAARYTNEVYSHQQPTAAASFFQELFDRAGLLAQAADITLRFSNLKENVECMLDREKAERAVYNLISNAMRFSQKGSTIEAALTRHGDKLHLTVTDEGSGISDTMRGSIFSRYLRQPALEDGLYGIGLGLVITRAAAQAHDGTVLMEQPSGKGTRFTLTLSIKGATGKTVRSPWRYVDYSGGIDHAMLELSQVLPYSAYKEDK